MQQLLNYVRGFSFGRMTYPNGGTFGPIERPYMSLLTVEEGACTMECDGVAVTVKSGQTGVGFARCAFRFHYARNLSTTAIWCEGFLPKIELAETVVIDGQSNQVETSTRVLALQCMGVDLGLSSNPRANALRDGLGHALCRAFVYDAMQRHEELAWSASVLAARDFIHESFGDEQLSVEMVAQHVGLSPQHLIVLFRQAIGTTPGRYLWQLRASKARELLIHSALSQQSIAFECGFKSPPHFSRLMKRLYGMTPAELRKDMGFTRPSDTEATVEDILF